ncbi:MAG: winged helix-turn-helix domain-containing protein [Methyloglobulus sp.]|nr:winged helix-turn-helix domain-containing protein [Methyloglobulus sp.]
MPELLIPIFIFFLTYLYHTMKKPNSPTEKTTTKAKTEKPVAAVATEAKTKDISPTKKPSNKQKTVSPKPMPMEKTEQPIAEAVTQTKPKKPSPTQKLPGKAKDVALIIEASTTEVTMPERVGLTAGDIWHYLNKNGATAVAKLVRELPEEEKIIQRSIGWLAQEGKIALDTIDRVETISLTGLS